MGSQESDGGREIGDEAYGGKVRVSFFFLKK